MGDTKGLVKSLDQRIVVCPACAATGVKSRVRPGTGSYGQSYDGFYDEDGFFHHHTTYTDSQSFSCTNGHSWREEKDRRFCDREGCSWAVPPTEEA